MGLLRRVIDFILQARGLEEGEQFDFSCYCKANRETPADLWTSAESTVLSYPPIIKNMWYQRNKVMDTHGYP
eukprot:5522589-Pyramimonas_sp.AAC.2